MQRGTIPAGERVGSDARWERDVLPKCHNDDTLWGYAIRNSDVLHHTGGKGSLTQGVHCEFMVGSETIRPHFTQRVHGGYFQKAPTNSPSKNPPGKV